MTVDKMLKKYIYIHKISRSSTVDVKSSSMKVYMILGSSQQMEKVHSSLFPAKQLIADVVNKFTQNIRKYGLLSFRILGRHNHRINTSNGISELQCNAESRVDRVVQTLHTGYSDVNKKFQFDVIRTVEVRRTRILEVRRMRTVEVRRIRTVEVRQIRTLEVHRKLQQLKFDE